MNEFHKPASAPIARDTDQNPHVIEIRRYRIGDVLALDWEDRRAPLAVLLSMAVGALCGIVNGCRSRASL